MIDAYQIDMASSTVTRRGVIGLLAVGLAGCMGSNDSKDTGNGNQDDGNSTDGNGEQDGLDRDIPDRDIDANWDEAAAFRTWLTDADPFNGGNRRFDYTESFPEDTDFSSIFPEYFGVSADTVDAHLIQSLTQVFFGSFDKQAIVDGVEDDDEYEFVEEYADFAVIDGAIPNSSGRRDIAVSNETIVVGPDYEERIDAHNGEHDRLEDVDQEFTHLFRQLPHETTVTGEYNAPAGDAVTLDEIYIWGVSSETPMADTMTWVFILEPGTDLTDEVVAELEEITSEVHESSVEGRTVTITGSAPEPPEPPEQSPSAEQEQNQE